MHDFTELLMYVIASRSPHLILGDFNVNFLDNPLPNIISLIEQLNCKQVVTHPTHISGGVIDHIYVSDGLLDKPTINMLSLYYSDHDAILLSF